MHASNSHTRRARGRHLLEFFRWNPLAFIFNLDLTVSVAFANANSRNRTSRVPVNIGETFLYHAENRGLHFCREPDKIFGHIEINSDVTALGKPADIPAERRSQPEFVEQRRMQQVGDRPDLSHHLTDKALTVV